MTIIIGIAALGIAVVAYCCLAIGSHDPND